MSEAVTARWDHTDWPGEAEATVRAELARAGHPVTGTVTTIKEWGRSCLQTAATADGLIWIKHGYNLPPGEDITLMELHTRHPGRVPEIICCWPGAVAMAPMQGEELTDEHSREDWLRSADAIASIAAAEQPFAEQWLALGVRDRRVNRFRHTLADLLESPVVINLADGLYDEFKTLMPKLAERFAAAFSSQATLVHQDSGCCNVHLTDKGPVIFDWADVVVGHPVFSCDRLLDQTPAAFRDDTINAFITPLALSREEFDAMHKSNVLHEIVRYHDELAFLEPGCELFNSLEESVRSQIRVLVNHELGR